MDATPTTIAYLGLGSNLGDRLSALRGAVAALESHSGIALDARSDVSSVYESAAFCGPSGQPDYLNSVLRIRTTLTPLGLLDAILTVESALGRVRPERWGPRVIDIDLLLFGALTIDDPRLVVPHPRMHERRFVLEPLREIAPNWIHPVLRVTIDELAKGLESPDDTADLRRIVGPEWCAPIAATA